MNACSKDIAATLVAEGVGTANAAASADGWGVYQTHEPNEPDKAVTVFDGTDVPRRHQAGTSMHDESLQVRVRCRSYAEGYAKGLAIIGILHGATPLTVSGTRYQSIKCLNGPNYLGFDEQRRRLFTVNFRTQRKEI